MRRHARLERLERAAPGDPYNENRRELWAEIRDDRARYDALRDDLNATLSPEAEALPNTLEEAERAALSWLYHKVITAHHTTGSPLALPPALVEAFLARAHDFTGEQPQGVMVTEHGCHGCCYPTPYRFWGEYDGPCLKRYLYDDLLSECPLCGAPVDRGKSYRALHGSYPSGSDRLERPLILYPFPNSVCDGTRPSDYGVRMPEGWHDA